MKHYRILDAVLEILAESPRSSSELMEALRGKGFSEDDLSLMTGYITSTLKRRGFLEAGGVTGQHRLSGEGKIFWLDGGFKATHRKERITRLLNWTGAIFAVLAFIAAVIQLFE